MKSSHNEYVVESSKLTCKIDFVHQPLIVRLRDKDGIKGRTQFTIGGMRPGRMPPGRPGDSQRTRSGRCACIENQPITGVTDCIRLKNFPHGYFHHVIGEGGKEGIAQVHPRSLNRVLEKLKN